MNTVRKIALLLAGLMTASAVTSCAVPNTANSITASASAKKYVNFLEERLDDMPDDLLIAVGDDAAAYGVDVSEFVDDEGYTIRAKNGEVIILGKTDAALDRAVRHFANYGNDKNYTFTYGERYRVKKLTIAGNDISEYAIVSPDDADECMLYAADELAKYIKLACGATLPEYSQSEYAAAVDKPKRLISLKIDYPALGDEAFTIDVKDDGDLDILGGRYRGGLYGVYGLMYDIGWRFLGDNIQHLYEAEHIDLTSDINRTETASIANRFCSDKSVWDNGVGSKLNLHGRYLDAAATSKYGFYGIVAQASHGLHEGNVDWQGYYDATYETAQPCFTNEDILQCIEDHVVKTIQARLDAGQEIGKDLTYIDVAQFDTQAFCQCSDCMEVFYEEGATSGAVLRMTNRMADVVAENFSDEISVLMLAYAGTNKPPKVTKPRDNVKISYCFYVDGREILCTNHNISGEGCPAKSVNLSFAKEFEEWTKICKAENMQVWYYPLNCYEIAFQLPCFDTAYADIQYLIDSEINCLMLCADYNNDTILASSISKLAWNGNMTEEEFYAMVEENFTILYGESGKYIHEYIMMLQTAGDLDGCWTAFHSGAADKVNDHYMATRFDYMTGLFKEALRLAETEEIERKIEILMSGMYYVCIGITYNDRYVNGTDEERAVIAERYTEMHRIFRENNLRVFDDFISTEYAPAELDLETNPFDSWCTLW